MNGWYVARIRMVCLIEGQGAVRYQDSLFLVSASSFQEAFQRALGMGHRQEQEYRNADKQRVRWRCKEVCTLDFLREGLVDGCELYSEPVDLSRGEQYDFDDEFRPEDSTPTETH